jgi:hypothetical protein
MAQLLVADKIASSLDLDRIICKVEYRLLGFGVSYVSGALIDCIQNGKEVTFDCLLSTITKNWFDNLLNIWQYTSVG